jgi:hypothetical protein
MVIICSLQPVNEERTESAAQSIGVEVSESANMISGTALLLLLLLLFTFVWHVHEQWRACIQYSFLFHVPIYSCFIS